MQPAQLATQVFEAVQNTWLFGQPPHTPLLHAWFIAHALHAKGFEIDKRKIQLHDPLKTLGETMVPVKIHRDVTAQVKVKVVAEQR